MHLTAFNVFEIENCVINISYSQYVTLTTNLSSLIEFQYQQYRYRHTTGTWLLDTCLE